MNTPNNKRRRDSQRRIERAFVQALQTQDLSDITVTQLCKAAGVNRTTFYSNYADVPALAVAVQRHLEEEVASLYGEERTHQYNSNNYLKLFRHIRENQLFYRTYFKLGADARFRMVEWDYDHRQADAYYGGKHLEYHMEFFRSGLNAVLKLWLENGCQESPEEIQQIIASEYGPKLIR